MFGYQNGFLTVLLAPTPLAGVERCLQANSETFAPPRQAGWGRRELCSLLVTKHYTTPASGVGGDAGGAGGGQKAADYAYQHGKESGPGEKPEGERKRDLRVVDALGA